MRHAGAVLFFLPSFSPDRNPVEHAFADLRQLLGHAAERTVSETWQGIGSFLDQVQSDKCANCIVNAGYVYG